MIRIEIKIEGTQRVADSIMRLPERLDQAFAAHIKSNISTWAELLKATISHVVYDAYDPTRYRRNQNLIKAVDMETEQIYGLGIRTEIARLFDNPALITLRRDPRGGSAPEDVPWQIEEGTYPTEWFGYAHPRPAYSIFADMIRPRIEADVEAIISQVIV